MGGLNTLDSSVANLNVLVSSVWMPIDSISVWGSEQVCDFSVETNLDIVLVSELTCTYIENGVFLASGPEITMF